MHERIVAGQRAQRWIRWSTSGTLTLLSIFLNCGIAFFFNFMDSRWLKGGTPCMAGRHVQFFAVSCGRIVPLAVWNLVPLADDLWMTRCVLLVDVVWSIREGNLWATKFSLSIEARYGIALPGWFIDTLVLWARAIELARVLGFLALMCRRSCSKMQADMWRLLAMSLVAEMAWMVAMVAALSHISCLLPAGIWVIFWRGVVLAFAKRPRWREIIHAWLARMYSKQYSYHAAASIAGLVGNCSADEVMLQACERFRGVHLKDLVFADLADNRPNPALFERTFPIKLLACDAFVSHSWHDDAEAKWEAMQDWRRRFVAANGREPVLWIDKCCIDQDNIVASLRCLPIFLSGCQKLVVFLGDTYLSRLWCVMELFTCAHMQHGLDRIECIPLGKASGARAVPRTLRKFDASTCECFKPEEKLRMLQIICAAYGDLSSFNAAVRDILRRAASPPGHGQLQDVSDTSDTISCDSSNCSSLHMPITGPAGDQAAVRVEGLAADHMGEAAGALPKAAGSAAAGPGTVGAVAAEAVAAEARDESMGAGQVTSTLTDQMLQCMSEVGRVSARSSQAFVRALASSWRWPQRPGEMPLYVQRSFRAKAFGLIGFQLLCVFLEMVVVRQLVCPRLDALRVCDRLLLVLGGLAGVLTLALNFAGNRYPANYVLILSTTLVVGAFWGLAPPVFHATFYFQVVGVLAVAMLLGAPAVVLLTRKDVSAAMALSLSVVSGWAVASCLDLFIVGYWSVCPLGVALEAIVIALVLLVLVLLVDAVHLLTKCNPDDFALVIVSMDSALLGVSLPLLAVTCMFLHTQHWELAVSGGAAAAEGDAAATVEDGLGVEL